MCGHCLGLDTLGEGRGGEGGGEGRGEGRGGEGRGEVEGWGEEGRGGEGRGGKGRGGVRCAERHSLSHLTCVASTNRITP